MIGACELAVETPEDGVGVCDGQAAREPLLVRERVGLPDVEAVAEIPAD